MSVSAPTPPVGQRPEPEADGQGANLTILEHLQEARRRLMICAAAVGVGLVVGAFLAKEVMIWMSHPAADRVEGFELIFTQPLEYWMTFFKVMLLVSLAVTMPILVWQVLAFVGPGLTRREKKWAYPIVLGAGGMFILGMAFAYYVGLPPALGFLLDGRGVATPLISVSKYVDFVVRFMLVTGLVFQTPLIVMALAKVGLVTSRKLLGWWRFAIVGAFIIAAIVTPSIDPITQTLFAGPMIFFYFVGIVLAKAVEQTPIIPRR
jgi:sec-independent protein translocase protein TatC